MTVFRTEGGEKAGFLLTRATLKEKDTTMGTKITILQTNITVLNGGGSYMRKNIEQELDNG